MSNSGGEHFECRVYTNWMNCKGAAGETSDNNINFMACNVTIRARIAGRVTPSTTSANCLDVIEIPTIGMKFIQIKFQPTRFYSLIFSSRQCEAMTKIKPMLPSNWPCVNAWAPFYVQKTDL